MPVAELLVVRHGESAGNLAAAQANAAGAEVIVVDRRDADVPLSQTGVTQAQALGQGLPAVLARDRPVLVYSSPYVRARQTAEIALQTADLAWPIIVDERLRDRELGVLDLLTTKGVAMRYPLEAERRAWLGKFYHRPPGGESWADVVLRLRSFLLDLNTVADGAQVLVVCHDALVLMVRYVCEGMSEAELLDIGAQTPVKNVSLTQLARRGGTGAWELLRYNDVNHLEQYGAPVTHHGGDPNVHPV
jgi:broad specificity phosphatase PhoE